MIYLFHGSDVHKVRTKTFEWITSARTKEPHLAYVRLSREEINPSALMEVALSGGLFIKRLLVLIDDPFPAVPAIDEEDTNLETSKGVFEEHLKMLAASDNAIVILAPRLASVKAKKIGEIAKKEYRYDAISTREVSRGFNTALVNALASRSREKLWLELQRAYKAGDAPEMLHGLLHWKARDLMMKGSRMWSREESRKLSLSLISLLQSSRRGGLALDLALEKFSISI